ncbi:MAG: hypothetical protein R3D71_00145 [Rickettsiales bacterium]
MRFLLLIIFTVVLFPLNVLACPMDVPSVKDSDINNPPSGMIAFKAVIEKIIPDKPQTNAKPHDGFSLLLKITKITQVGSLSGGEITVEYGGCHNLPGDIGDEINVLARKNKENKWYAPQFWTRSK